MQRDVVRIVNSSGTVVVEYTYDAWGKVLTTTGSLASTVGKYNPFRYRGCYYDTETGWYYLQSRYYDPVVGRFLNADGYVSTGQGILGYNMYAYCGNNPVIRIDAEGKLWGIIIGFGITLGTLLLSGCDAEPDTEPLTGTIADPAPKTTRYNSCQEAVDAGFNIVESEYFNQLDQGNNWEHMCIIYEYEGGYYVSSPYHTRSYDSVYYFHREGAVASIHTHPHGNISVFSGQDLTVAKNYKIETYVTVVGHDPFNSHKRYHMSYTADNCGEYSKYYTSDESGLLTPARKGNVYYAAF